MNDKNNLSPTRRLFASDTFRRHYVSAVENGEQAEWTEQEQGGNLGRVFVFLLLLHVFLIGAIVLYNLVSDRPKVPITQGVGKAPTPDAAGAAITPEAGNVLRRSELSEYQVRSGDSLKSISDATGATTDEIIKLNKLDDNGELYVGRRLQLPMRKAVPQEVAAPAAIAIPMPGEKAEHVVAAAKEVSGKAGKGQPESFKAAIAPESGSKASNGKTKSVTLQDNPPAEHAKTVKAEDMPPAGRAETAGSTQRVPVASPVKLQEAPPKEKPAAKPPVVAEKEKPAVASGG
ncbi:MAG TPA: LysM peptidoglycan-binding domain-containing protein, partial [Verrucomicrobium sp.]|nr:LysM peptidoglycan-binding domain-containing protein [Verrucomicrobium sp.]